MRRPRAVESGEGIAAGSERIPILVCSGLCVLSICCLFVGFATIVIALESGAAPDDVVVSVLPSFVVGGLGVVGTIVSGGLVFVFRH